MWASSFGPARPRAIGCDGAGGCVIASQAPARDLLPHVLNHLPLARHELERLGYILADFAQRRPAAARAGRGWWINDPLARQMRGQRTARRRAPLERCHRDRLGCRQLRRGLGLRRILFQIGKLQFKLIEQ